ncbi:MAG: hypothetical protein HQL27_06450 [Candidatus Omnitrophica bacterium]|nr:hypothetical protein [Candidatus Omnitrophota bacterium]
MRFKTISIVFCCALAYANIAFAQSFSDSELSAMEKYFKAAKSECAEYDVDQDKCAAERYLDYMADKDLEKNSGSDNEEYEQCKKTDKPKQKACVGKWLERKAQNFDRYCDYIQYISETKKHEYCKKTAAEYIKNISKYVKQELDWGDSKIYPLLSLIRGVSVKSFLGLIIIGVIIIGFFYYFINKVFSK